MARKNAKGGRPDGLNLILFSIFLGCHTVALLKSFWEIAGTVKAYGETDIGHALLAGGQLLRCLQKAVFVQILRRSRVGELCKASETLALAHICSGWNFWNGNWLSIVLMDIIQHEPHSLLSENLRGSYFVLRPLRQKGEEISPDTQAVLKQKQLVCVAGVFGIIHPP